MGIEALVGTVPEEWKYTTLGEACARGGGDIQTGPFGSQLHASDYVPSGIPSIMPQNIGDNRVIPEGIAQITRQDAERLSRYRVQQGDIVYSRRGDVEKRALIRRSEDGWLCGTGCLRVRFGDGQINSDYACYYLGDPRVREWVVRHAHGATMPNLNTGILSELPFVVPPLNEQHGIAHVLGTLDKRIELNRRINRTLEGMARTLFKSWFVHFDPVRAKAEGRNMGLPKSLNDLFPGSFDDSESGQIPHGWTVEPLDQIAHFVNGLALQKFPPKNSRSLPVIKIAQLRAGSTKGADSASADIVSDYIVEDGDVLFSWSGSLECVLWSGGRGALNQHLFKVTSKAYPKWLYYLWIHEHLDHFRQIAAAKATTMGHIQRHHLSEVKVVLPNRAVFDAADRLINPLIESIPARAVQSRMLGLVRDSLLPKLMSGEIRVADVRKNYGVEQ